MRAYEFVHVAKARAVLIEAATVDAIVSRKELVERTGLGVWNPERQSDVRMMASLLGEVADAEYRANRPFVTVVLMAKERANLDDFGLLGYAERLGFPVNCYNFIQKERVRVYEYWRLSDKAPEKIA